MSPCWLLFATQCHLLDLLHPHWISALCPPEVATAGRHLYALPLLITELCKAKKKGEVDCSVNYISGTFCCCDLRLPEMPFVTDPFSNKWDTKIHGLLSKLLSCLPRVCVTNCVQDIGSKSYIWSKYLLLKHGRLCIWSFYQKNRKEDICTCVRKPSGFWFGML